MGSVTAVKEILGAAVSEGEKVREKEEKVEVVVVSLVVWVIWYWAYLWLSVTQELEEISLPEEIEEQEEKAVAPDMEEELLVRTLTVAVVLVGVVEDKVKVPQSLP